MALAEYQSKLSLYGEDSILTENAKKVMEDAEDYLDQAKEAYLSNYEDYVNSISEKFKSAVEESVAAAESALSPIWGSLEAL